MQQPWIVQFQNLHGQIIESSSCKFSCTAVITRKADKECKCLFDGHDYHLQLSETRIKNRKMANKILYLHKTIISTRHTHVKMKQFNYQKDYIALLSKTVKIRTIRFQDNVRY